MEESKGPWRATRLWNEIVNSFRGGMPLKRHRKSVLAAKSFDNCFAGCEALDWLLKYLKKNPNFGQGVSKEQASLLLEKLLKAGVFRPVGSKTEFPIFRESDLYVFPNDIERIQGEGGAALASRKQILHPLILMDKGGMFFKEVFLSQCLSIGVSLLPHEVNLDYITSNMTRVSESGIVLPPEDSAERIPHWVISAIKCLADWPVGTGGNNPLPNYKGFETDVFNVVKEYFTSLGDPLIPYELYSRFTKTFIHATVTTSTPLQDQTPGIQRPLLPPNTCFETAFMQESPVTRIVAQKETDSLHLASSPREEEEDDVAWNKKRYRMPGWRRSSRSRKSIAVMERLRFRASTGGETDKESKRVPRGSMDNLIDNTEQEHRFPLADLPSVIHSKTVRRQKQKSRRDRSAGGRIEDRLAYPTGGYFNPLCPIEVGYETSRYGDLVVKTPLLPLGPSSADSILNEVERRKSQKKLNVESVVQSCKLLALLLPPTNRRKIQLLLKFMKKASENSNLVLCSSQDTSEIMLSTFQNSILRPQDLSDYDVEFVSKIIRFFVSYYEEIWTPPLSLRREVEERVYESLVSHNINSGDPFPITYCQQVSKENYEQNRVTESRSALLDLLRHLIFDNKLSVKEKRKKVKRFKDSYPDIYKLQFPDKGSEPEYMKSEMHSPKLSSLSRFKNAMRI